MITQLGRAFARNARIFVSFLALTNLVQAANIDWVRQFGASRDDISFGVAADDQGGTYFCGGSQNLVTSPMFGEPDAFVGRYDAAGNLLWMRNLSTPSYDSARAVSYDGHENVYVTGETLGALVSPSLGEEDGYLAKYNTAGDLLWTRQFGSANIDSPKAVAADGTGNVFVSGLTRGNIGGPALGNDDGFVAKYDAAGNQLWARQIATPLEDGATGVVPDAFGNVYVTGYTHGSLAGPAAYYENAFVAKYDAAGNPIWTRQFGATQGDVGERTTGYALTADALGNVYMAGETTEDLFGTGSGAILCKFDPAGNMVWGKRLDLDESAFGYGVFADKLGHVYVAGRDPRNMGGHDDDAFVNKYDVDGNFIWTQRIGTEKEDYSWTVSGDQLGNVFISGFTKGDLAGNNAGWSDAFVAKISETPEPGSITLVAILVAMLSAGTRRRRVVLAQ